MITCARPFIKGADAFPCGKCLPCRTSKRRVWTARILLEASCHAQNCFLTLTYDKENYPADASVSPAALSGFIKRLRFAVTPIEFRFFGVGEYGDNTQRAHYHVILFGLDGRFQKEIEKSWGLGFVSIGMLSPESAKYVAGYTVKKLNAARTDRQIKLLAGRHPEFTRQSNRPGIGASALKTLEDFCTSDIGSKLMLRDGDVLSAIQIGGKSLPLGSYIRRKLREQIGITPAESAYIREKRTEMRAMFKAAGAVSQLEKTDVIANVNEPRVMQAEARAKIYQSRKTL